MAASQRGIPRPRKTEVDLRLREAILDVLARLQGTGTLSALAEALQISVKTLSRYRSSPGNGKPATMGGDLLFRICRLCDERDISIACHDRILRLPNSNPSAVVPSAPEQLRFKFAGTIDINVPARKSTMRVDSIIVDHQTKIG